jgi:CRP-like cAMP-binding protein
MEPMPSEPRPAPTTLTSDERERVARWAERRSAGVGDRLVSEGATGYFFYVIEAGTAEVSREGVTLHALGPGDFFGELAITGDGRRTASVTATSELTYLAIFGSDFRRFEREAPEVAQTITRAIAQRRERDEAS